MTYFVLSGTLNLNFIVVKSIDVEIKNVEKHVFMLK